MTGILPIKKYGKHSALNMFDEYSMTLPQHMAPYMGFTAEDACLSLRNGTALALVEGWDD